MDEIIWKTVVYNGEAYNQFEVSNDGQLRNVKTGTIYKQHINQKGYNQVYVSLGSRKIGKVFKIHRAVAEAFIPNPYNKDEVNHKDGNKNNNNVSNLEWMTASENVQHAYKNGLMPLQYGMDNHEAKLSKDDVLYIREHFIYGDREYGARALGRKFNISKNSILDIARGISYINI